MTKCPGKAPPSYANSIALMDPREISASRAETSIATGNPKQLLT
jgi:hypothetical protein